MAQAMLREKTRTHRYFAVHSFSSAQFESRYAPLRRHRAALSFDKIRSAALAPRISPLSSISFKKVEIPSVLSPKCYYFSPFVPCLPENFKHFFLFCLLLSPAAASIIVGR